MTRIAAVLVVAAVLAGGGAASHASAEGLALGGATAGVPVTGDIYVVSSAGGTRHALTSTEGVYELQPSVSPDGRSIAYLSYGGIQLMNPDGSGQHLLGTASGERPQWSPDGHSLAYSAGNASLCIPPAQRCMFTDVWTVNADGTGERKVLDGAAHPVWSAAGRRLLFRDFVVGEGGDVVDSLKVAWRDGSNVHTLSRARAIDGVRSLPAWSPNGKWIAFNTFNMYESYHRLFVIRPDGSHLRKLNYGTYPAWSPNGKLIAFERDHGVWVIPLTGKRARRISTYGDCPTWSPGGKWIAYLTNRHEVDSKLVIVRPDGRGRRVLATAANCYSYGWAEPSPPSWSRDGRSIYFVG
jgi:Tol biopolymer transport system component